MDLVINLNKPKGITSHEATLSVKKILKAKKAGHTGTLDPMATGLLLICVNRATRLASYFSSLDKEYRTVMKLGEITDTQDSCGTVLEKTDRVDTDRVTIEKTLRLFEGKILQKPPMFSALKYKGKPLYKYAKKGIDVPRSNREVIIRHIELLSFNLPFVSFRTICSKGTYIRTLCDDIGKELGIGAHLFELERTAIGQFHIKDSLSIEELQSVNINNLRTSQFRPDNKGIYPVRKNTPLELSNGVYTMDSALSWMPELKIKQSHVKSVRNGVPIKTNYYPDFRLLKENPYPKGVTDIKIKSPDSELLAIGSFLADRKIIRIDVVFGM